MAPPPGTPDSLGFEQVTRNNDRTPVIKELNQVEMVLVPTRCFVMGSTDAQVDDAMQRREELLVVVIFVNNTDHVYPMSAFPCSANQIQARDILV